MNLRAADRKEKAEKAIAAVAALDAEQHNKVKRLVDTSDLRHVFILQIRAMTFGAFQYVETKVHVPSANGLIKMPLSSWQHV